MNVFQTKDEYAKTQRDILELQQLNRELDKVLRDELRSVHLRYEFNVRPNGLREGITQTKTQ